MKEIIRKIFLTLFCLAFSGHIYANKLDDLNNTLEGFKRKIATEIPAIITQLTQAQTTISSILNQIHSKEGELVAAQKKIDESKSLILTTKTDVQHQQIIPSLITDPLITSLDLQQQMVDELKQTIADAKHAVNIITQDANTAIRNIGATKADITNLATYLRTLIEKGQDLIRKLSFKI
ncbi:MAG: hypothetical protein WC707_04615 [Candidatus Babeliaceae bacterium]|jgi:chromosome segregation ATPase